MPKAMDHVVVAVNDLAQTIQDYVQLGFTVTIGGDHAHRGSHNALITLQDGSYIELIAFKHEPPVKDNTWWDLLQIGEGLVDFALVSDDLLAEVAALQERNYTITGPMEGGRVRTDGIKIAWRVARLNTAGTERLPFVIDDITAHELRVPLGDDAIHPNGVTGIAGVTVAVHDLAAATALYQGLLGDPDSTGETVRFLVGDQFVDLVDGAAGEEVAGFLATFGSGPYRVSLRGSSELTGGTRELPARQTHAARFAIT